MVTHIVIFRWLPETTAEQIAALGVAFDRLREQCSHLASLHHGPDLAFRAGNGDYALVAQFADQGRWAAYQDDPAHKAVVREYIAPIQASRLAIQF